MIENGRFTGQVFENVINGSSLVEHPLLVEFLRLSWILSVDPTELLEHESRLGLRRRVLDQFREQVGARLTVNVDVMRESRSVRRRARKWVLLRTVF